MKKLLVIGLVLILVFSFAGCAGGAVKTGIGVETSIASSTSVSQDKAGAWVPGNAQVDSYIVAVALSGDKVTSVSIDSAQTKIAFDQGGLITTSKTSTFKTKNELADAYGMKAKSAIGKEWWEEAAALADWMTGKSIDDIKALTTNPTTATTNPGAPTNADLTSSVTIDITNIMKAFAKAVDAAQAK